MSKIPERSYSCHAGNYCYEEPYIEHLESELERKSNNGEQYKEQTVEVWEENKKLKQDLMKLRKTLKYYAGTKPVYAKGPAKAIEALKELGDEE